VNIARKSVSAVLLVHNAVPIGRWSSVVWNARRYLPEYAAQFADELVAELRQTYPGQEFTRRAPALPRPVEE
jgi:hypothetical protein